MNSKDALLGIVFVWSVFGLLTGIVCHQGGVQIEDILLTGLLAVIVLLATAQLSGMDVWGRLRGISTFFPPFDR